jgi:hypothetical protein
VFRVDSANYSYGIQNVANQYGLVSYLHHGRNRVMAPVVQCPLPERWLDRDQGTGPTPTRLHRKESPSLLAAMTRVFGSGFRIFFRSPTLSIVTGLHAVAVRG